MGKLSKLGSSGIFSPVQRRQLRQIRPSRWQHEGLTLYKGKKYRSFWITHADLIGWVGGLDVLQERYEYAEDVMDFLWLLFERYTPYVYSYFVEVMEPNEERMVSFCKQHFASKLDGNGRSRSPVFPFPAEK